MLEIEYKEAFLKTISKIKDATFKKKVKKKVEKILENPEIGKSMRYVRKGTRELYIEPYRLAYSFIAEENKIVFIDIYHKDEQ